MAKKKQKIRTSFRKNRNVRVRQKDLTKSFDKEQGGRDDVLSHERVSGKGDLTRKRTVFGGEADQTTGFAVLPFVDTERSQRGRVLSVQGLISHVQAEDSRVVSCTTRGLLKTLSTDQRHAVAAGDYVWFCEQSGDGVIERVEPRHGVLNRTSRGRQHVVVTNVDQLVIVASAAEPYLKPNLVDRFLVTAEKNHIEPLVCINKVDLVEQAILQPLVGVWSQLGYRVLLLSTQTGQGVERLRVALVGRESVLAGQSGVGKSSLINAVQPGLDLAVKTISAETEKGRHTTTTARLLSLGGGGYVVDTPGIRQYQLWDLIPEEVASYYREMRPYVSRCRFPDCTHTHEINCAVKDAVADARIDARRYESYVQLVGNDHS